METLTRRESEVAELIALGWAKKEVADKLGISTNTVATLSKRIFDKLQIQKSTELSVWYFITKYKIVLKDGVKASIAIALIFSVLMADFRYLRPLRTTCKRPDRSISRFRESDPLAFNS